MKIRIKTADELNKLLDALALEIVNANIYHQLHKDLLDSRTGHSREFAQSNTFWSFTFTALNDARTLRICRIFDQESKSLNLFNLLETIKANMHFFEKNHFKERLKDNAFVDSLSEVDRIPDKAQLEKDICFASKQNPIVKKLMVWRNNIVAHKGAKVSLGNNDILTNNAVSSEELEALLDGCFEIFNRYSSLYRASTWSRQVIGHDDYQNLLNFIKLGLNKWDEDIGKELQDLQQKQAEQNKPAEPEKSGGRLRC
ncbi:MAG: hypothetical protein NTW44_01740 [Nitrospirae bacterium]|nr:hypothetical protein [Nitrospirota bacterium]